MGGILSAEEEDDVVDEKEGDKPVVTESVGLLRDRLKAELFEGRGKVPKP